MSDGAFYTFYHSDTWRKTRKSYIKSVGGLCELCLKNGIYKPARIVHHKIWLNSKNISDPNVTLSWSNLLAVCREHHEKIHNHPRFKFQNEKDTSQLRYHVLDDGTVIPAEAPPSS